MPLTIHDSLCNKCGLCAEICPMDAIRLDDDGKPYLAYDECWYCGSCECDCPQEAIRVEMPFLIK